MNVIKFRGKLNSNRKWVYGMPSYDLQYIFNDENLDSPDNFEVNPKTISQCSPFKDKNGKEIFEGDIIGDWTEVDGIMEQSKMQVYFDEMFGQWMLDCSLNQDRSISYSLFKELEDFEYEVIGNIFENQQLVSEAV